MEMNKKRGPFYGLLEYLDPSEYFETDDWQYEGTEESSSGVYWDIVSRKDSFTYECRYTSIERD